MKITVTVELKSAVLDPQGKAIQHSLSALGFPAVEDVRVGKVFHLTLGDDKVSKEELDGRIRSMCEKLLANPVVENYSYTIES
ncbi:MAG: phosphoribosylformylglycinamidine synthase subunit PurS [Thermoanaerobaculia bacterium]